MATGTVALRPHLFDKEIGAPALEATGSVFDTLNYMVARQKRFFRTADGRIEGFGTIGPDSGRGENGVAMF